MDERNFMKMLEAKWDERKFVSVGLDPNISKLPESIRTLYPDPSSAAVIIMFLHFFEAIIYATYRIVCCYKPDLAFFVGLGSKGLDLLRQVIEMIHEIDPTIPVILDGKYGGTYQENLCNAAFAFDELKADAVTVQPYFGGGALLAFLDWHDKGTFVICHSSNLDAGEFQDRDISGDVVPDGCMPLYKYVAHRVSREWDKKGNCALVVGATYTKQLHEVREVVGNMPILVPGVGVQGGDVEKAVLAGRDRRGKGVIINASRSIIYASQGADFDEKARQETVKLSNLIKAYL